MYVYKFVYLILINHMSYSQHFHKQPFAVDTRCAHKSSSRDTDVKVCEALVPAPQRTVGRALVRTHTTSLSSIMWLLDFRQKNKPAWHLFKTGALPAGKSITHDSYGLIIGFFISFFNWLSLCGFVFLFVLFIY